MNKLFRLALTLVSLAALVAASPAPARASQPLNAVSAALAARAALIRSAAIHASDGNVRVIVELSAPPTAAYAGGIPGLPATRPSPANGRPFDPGAPASRAYTGYLKMAQSAFLDRLQRAQPGARQVASYQATFNGLALEVAPERLEELMALPGVKAVYPDQLRQASLDASLPLINAQAAWTALNEPAGAGQGIKIALVDTGIRPANPMFSGTGFSKLAGFPKGYCVDHPADPAFQCNAKVIAANVFGYVSSQVSSSEVDTPLDIAGHGSHTAGIAAGDRVTVPAGDGVPVATPISGVVPAAYLMIYKALFLSTDNKTASGSDDGLMQAMDAAFQDGAQIISNSWGSDTVLDPNATAEKPMIDTITDHGVLVVFAAGNIGPGSGTVACPGCVASALTVASSTTGRIFANDLSVTGPGSVPPGLANQAALQGTGPALSQDLDAPLAYVVSNPDGCQAFAAGALSGAIAVVQRGNCTFVAKITSAALAGAKAVVIVNNTPGAPVYFAAGNTSIPSVMVDQSSGTDLVAWITAHPSATAHLAAGVLRFVNPAWQDILSYFSSAGPDGDPDVLKPDITAPGQLILSAYSPVPGASDPVYALLQGTSMSAPMVSGAAALLLQAHNKWLPLQVKTALTSTSVQALTRLDDATQALRPANPFDMGAGRLDLGRAIHASLTFGAPSFATDICVVVCQFTGTMTNVTSATLTWNAALSSASGLGLAVDPPSLTVDSEKSASFTLTIDASAVKVGQWAFAQLTWQDAGHSYPGAVLPVAVKSAASSNPDAIRLSVDKPVYQASDALTYTLTVGNIYPQGATYTVNDPIPANTTYLPGSANGLAPSADGKSLVATLPNIPALVAGIAPASPPVAFTAYFPEDGGTDLAGTCASPCANTWATVSPVDFVYMGVHYTAMTVFSSGFLIPGAVSAVPGDTTTPYTLPKASTLNNIIAPLWGDLVMQTGSVWQVWQASGYTVYDWENWTTPGGTQSYSFQVWIQNGASQVFFCYGPLGSLAGVPITVGMENDSGSQGATWYHWDRASEVGAAPIAGNKLAVNNSMSFVTLSFQAKVIAANPLQPDILNYATATDSLHPGDLFTAAVHSILKTYRVYFPLVPAGKQ